MTLISYLNSNITLNFGYPWLIALVVRITVILPSEGANNIALALFTFPSLASYEVYRKDSFADPECRAAFDYTKETGCAICERSF